MLNRNHSLWEGGDKTKIEHTITELNRVGVQANYACDVNADYDVDLVHLFHISYPHSYSGFINTKRQNLPLVVSAVYSGETLPRNLQQKVVDYASRIVFLSQGEMDYVHSRLVIDQSKATIVKNGVSLVFDCRPKVGRYVLNVGRIYAQKNQLSLAQACRSLQLPLKCVGQVIDEQYAKDVCLAGAELLPNVAQTKLIPLYQNSQVLACVSTHEVQPNCVLEGGLCGANIVLTARCCSFGGDFPNMWICEPTPQGIATALQQTWEHPKTKDLKNIFRDWKWERVAARLRCIYEEVLFEWRQR